MGSKAAGTARKRAANGRFRAAEQTTEAGAKEAPEKKKRPIRNVEEYADREFRREFPEIFDGLCGEAKKGGVSQARLLQQWSTTGDAKTAKRRGKKSLSELLLDELKRRQDEREAAAKTAADERESSSKGETSGGDAERE